MGGGVVAKKQGSGAIGYWSDGPVAAVRGDQPLKGGHLSVNPPLIEVVQGKSLLRILSGDDLEIAAWHVEGRRQEDMAEWLGVSLRTIERRIARIRHTLNQYGLPMPESPKPETDTRHIRSSALLELS